MIDCRAFDDMHRTHREGTPPPEARAAMEGHLARCPSCLARVRNDVTVSEILLRLGEYADADLDAEPPLPPALTERILAAHRRASATGSGGNLQQGVGG